MIEIIFPHHSLFTTFILIVAVYDYCFNFSEALINEYSLLREKIHNFMSRFISDLVFKSEFSPDEEIMKWLVAYITDGSTTKEEIFFEHKAILLPKHFTKGFFLKLMLRLEATDFICRELDAFLGSPETQIEQASVTIIDCYNVSVHAYNTVRFSHIGIVPSQVEI